MYSQFKYYHVLDRSFVHIYFQDPKGILNTHNICRKVLREILRHHLST